MEYKGEMEGNLLVGDAGGRGTGTTRIELTSQLDGRKYIRHLCPYVKDIDGETQTWHSEDRLCY